MFDTVWVKTPCSLVSINPHFNVLFQSLKLNKIRHRKRLCRLYSKWLDKVSSTQQNKKKHFISICRQAQPNELLNHSTDDINTNPKDPMQDNNPRPHNHVNLKHITMQSCWFPSLSCVPSIVLSDAACFVS
jgi:hypothetical protein